MHWELGPAEVGAAIAAGIAVLVKGKQRMNGGSIKERLVRLESSSELHTYKLNLILSSMELGPKSDPEVRIKGD